MEVSTQYSRREKMIGLVWVIEQYRKSDITKDVVIQRIDDWLRTHPDRFSQVRKIQTLQHEVRILLKKKQISQVREQLRQRLVILNSYGKNISQARIVYRCSLQVDDLSLEQLNRIENTLQRELEHCNHVKMIKLQEQLQMNVDELKELMDVPFGIMEKIVQRDGISTTLKEKCKRLSI